MMNWIFLAFTLLYFLPLCTLSVPFSLQAALRRRETNSLKSTVGKKTSLNLLDLNSMDKNREKEWEKHISQYNTILNGQYETWYLENKVKLNPKRSGVRGASVIINDEHRIMMCTIPKVGSSTWRKFMLYLAFPHIDEVYGKKHYFEKYGVKRPDFHNISKNGVKLMAVQDPATALEYYNDPSMLKVIHTRNPVTRLLSAWLSKNAVSKDPKPFAMKYSTFREFVHNLQDNQVDLRKADGHIRYQHTYCDFDRGAHYDVILKFEHRKYWGKLLLKYLQVEDDPRFLAMVNVSQRHFMGADVMKVILSHYNLDTFAIVKTLYEKDIQYFGYERDVEFIEGIIRSVGNMPLKLSSAVKK